MEGGGEKGKKKGGKTMKNMSTCFAWSPEKSDEVKAKALMETLGSAKKKLIVLGYRMHFPEWYEDGSISETLQKFLERYKRPYEKQTSRNSEPLFVSWDRKSEDDRATIKLFQMLQGGIKDATLEILKETVPMWFNGTGASVQTAQEPKKEEKEEPVASASGADAYREPEEEVFDFPDPEDAFD